MDYGVFRQSCCGWRGLLCAVLCAVWPSRRGAARRENYGPKASAKVDRPTCTKSRGGPGDDPGIGQWGHFCSGSHPEQLDSAPTCRFPPACSIVPFLHILAPLFLCFPCRCGCRWQRCSRNPDSTPEAGRPTSPETRKTRRCSTVAPPTWWGPAALQRHLGGGSPAGSTFFPAVQSRANLPMSRRQRNDYRLGRLHSQHAP